MTRGRSRKRHRGSRKSTDENDHFQTGQGEEIATPPSVFFSWRPILFYVDFCSFPKKIASYST
jgi:hypothetical protein